MEKKLYLKQTGPAILPGAFSSVGGGGDSGKNINPNAPVPTAYEAQDLLGVFQSKAPSYRTALKEAMEGEAIDRVILRAGEDFSVLVPRIPYVGPLMSPLAMTLVESAMAMVFYRNLKAGGMSVEEAGQMIVAASEVSLRASSREELLAEGEKQFTGEWYRIQAFLAAESQKRRYPGDWVYDFVAGEPGRFDWGWDFTECGIFKFYEAQGVTELMPFICVQDFIVSRCQGTGLARSGTIAEGADRCDFRYRKGREVPLQRPE